MIEGTYATWDDLLKDPTSTTRNVFDFGRSADDANQRCNEDKQSALNVLHGGEK